MRTGQLELTLALEASIARAGEAWVNEARRTMAELCKWRVTFSAEDIIAAIGMPPGKSHNAVGAVIRAAAAEGWIEEAGSRRSSRPDRHGGRVIVWRAAS